MTPTIFGVLVVARGLLLLARGTMAGMLRALMALSLMGGSAAVVLTAIGGSTVQPAILFLGFLVLRVLAPQPGSATRLGRALHDLAPLVVFALYGAVAAFILPRLFAGALAVTPLRPIPNGYIYAAYPLAFSSQNVTSAVYLTSTLLAAICGYCAVTSTDDLRPMARTAGQVAAVHALLGFASVLLGGTVVGQVLRFFRNGFYAQLDQTVEGLTRMTGIFPESAVYAAYGVTWLVFACELWLRGVEPRWTGTGAALLALALAASTSTTAYIGLGGYSVILALRMALMPRAIPLGRGMVLVAAGLAGLAGVLALSLFDPATAASLARVGEHLTIAKINSASALQRAFWARQGIDAFLVSHGLGIGPGSFRSSSIVLAILGSTGVVGTAAVFLHLLRVFAPLRSSTYVPSGLLRRDFGAAAAWATVIPLIPASFSAASPDPGFVWGLLGGMALALRRHGAHRATPAPTSAEPLRDRPLTDAPV